MLKIIIGFEPDLTGHALIHGSQATSNILTSS